MPRIVTQQPTVVLTIQTPDHQSHVAFNESGELIETVDHEYVDGIHVPCWEDGGICDGRGGGEAQGFKALHRALTAGEENARLCGIDVKRLPAIM